MEIIIPILTLSSLGLVFGAGLALAAKKFCVEEDPRLSGILSSLPGANCGACGKAGCIGFAESLIQGECSINSCAITEAEERKKISHILGVELEEKVKTIAVLHCGGGNKVKDRFIYNGPKTCAAANLVMGGQKECVYGCLGFGDCEKVCAFDAIKMSAEGLPVVDAAKCTACGKCVAACPKKLFTLAPITSPVYVACRSLDLGKDTKAVCPVGCIACKLCEKACKFDAIHVINNVAVIDYHKCTSCGECVKVCPTKAILTR